jgi:hypothetical protein
LVLATCVLALLIIVTYFFASGYYNSAFTSNLSKTDSELINSTDVNSNQSIPLPTATPTPTATPIPIPVDFRVNGTSNGVISTNIDLNDGMDQTEAIMVAQQLLARAHPGNITYEFKSAEVDAEGVWTVSLPWGLVSPDGTQESHSHYFITTIDPTSLTVDYGTCF